MACLSPLLLLLDRRGVLRKRRLQQLLLLSDCTVQHTCARSRKEAVFSVRG